MRNTFTKGGIHPAPNKTASRHIELLPLPLKAYVPLNQHIGAPATAIVAKGDRVTRGQVVATHSSFISADIHAPITGTVTAIENIMLPWGKSAPALIISATPSDHDADTEAREEYWRSVGPRKCDRNLSESLSAADIRTKILSAGIVGLGGATFPSHAKLSIKEGSKADILIINGCECEPYLMCDDALMCTYPSCILEGIELMLKAAGIERAVIAIEDNKPLAAKALQSAIESHWDIRVQILKTKYPQGGEKQLVEAVTGRRIASGALPLSVGAVVHNVATAFAVWQAVAMDMPLIERVVTVTGDIPEEERRNYMVAIGTPLSALPVTFPKESLAIIGGPMMGRSAVNPEAPIIKGTSGLTVLSYQKRTPEPCIRCGACVEACPMGLEPYLLATYGRLQMWEEAAATSVADCLECGSCSYSCPASRPLVEYIRLAKQRARKLK